MSTQERIALVTGGSRGIGREICLRLARDGVKVGINYVSRPDAAEQVRAAIEEAGGQAFLAPFDVGDAQAAAAGVKEVIDAQGGLHILVNNAGITRDGLMMRMKDQDWDAVLDINLRGAFVCARAASRAMMKARWGRVVNITSVIGFIGNAGQANYAAAKAGMVGLTRSLARELAPRGITVNAVAPGYIVTDMTSELSEEQTEMIRAQVPLGTLGGPADVAGAVAFLCGDEAAYVTGQTLHVNGGMYMG